MKINALIVSTLLTLLVAAPLAAQQDRVRRARVFVGGDEITVVDGEDDARVLVSVQGGYLGVSTTNLTAELRQHFGATESGVLVAKVFDDTPASRAGLRVGDVIVRVDGKDVTSSWELSRALRTREKGEQVRIDYLRDRRSQQASVTLDERKGPMAWTFEGGELPRLGELEEALVGVRAWSSDPKVKARLLSFGECDSLREQISDLEKRLKDLEKKLQK